MARRVRECGLEVKQADVFGGKRRMTTNLTTKPEDRWRKQAIRAEFIADCGIAEVPGK
jgi:hypothetical protein